MPAFGRGRVQEALAAVVLRADLRPCGVRTYAEALVRHVPGAWLDEVAGAGGHPALRRLVMEARLLRRPKARVVHSASPDFVHARSNLVTIHDFLPWRYPELLPGPAERFLWNHMARRALAVPTIIVDTPRMAETLSRDHGVDPGRLHVVPLGMDESCRPDAHAWHRAHQARGEQAQVVVLSNMAPHKRVDIVLEGIAHLGPQVEVIHVGHAWTGPAHQESFNAAVCGLGSRYRRAENLPRDDLVRLLQTADAVVDANVDAGFGIPMLEAAGCGTPCAAAGVAPHHGRDWADYFEPLAVQQAATAVERAISKGRDPARRAELAARVRSEYSWSRTAELTARVYHEVAGDGG